MSDFARRAELQVFAGPNGSGKSTITPAFPIGGEYVNADDIQRQGGVTNLEAAELAMQLKQYYIENRRSFTFETVMSSPYNLDVLRRARERGFAVTVVYVITRDAAINVERVRSRVRAGGHDVPEDKIRARYARSLANIAPVFALADNFVLMDNSGEKPALLADKTPEQLRLFPTAYWSTKRIGDLLAGNKL